MDATIQSDSSATAVDGNLQLSPCGRHTLRLDGAIALQSILAENRLKKNRRQCNSVQVASAPRHDQVSRWDSTAAGRLQRLRRFSGLSNEDGEAMAVVTDASFRTAIRRASDRLED